MNYLDIQRNIHVLSDIHLEHYTKLPDFSTIITPNYNGILCLCGDIGNPFSEIYYKFIRWCSGQFSVVLILTGNHEYYGSNIKDVNNRVQIVAKNTGTIFLNNSCFIHQGIVFIGTTLWSFIPEHVKNIVESRLNDYHLVQNFTTETSNILHSEAVKFISNSIDYFSNEYKHIVVLSHHTPLFYGTSPKHLESLDTNYAFSSDLSYLVEKVSVWIYGHTHYNHPTNVFYYKKTKMISNQRGYPGKMSINYNPNFSFSIY